MLNKTSTNYFPNEYIAASLENNHCVGFSVPTTSTFLTLFVFQSPLNSLAVSAWPLVESSTPGWAHKVQKHPGQGRSAVMRIILKTVLRQKR